MFHRFVRHCALVCLLMLAVIPASAQTSAPIILWVMGDLYAADADRHNLLPERLTQDGAISAPTLAVNATFPGGVIAYKTLAAIGRDALDRVPADGFIAEFDLPADIVLFDLATRSAIAVVGQPEGASLFVDGTPDNAIVRSSPSWSPDGSRLVWTELAFGTEAASLVVFDFTSGARTSAALPGVPIFGGRAPDVRAGALYDALRSTAATGEQRVWFVNRAGVIEGTASVTLAADQELVEYVWTSESHLDALLNTGAWLRIAAPDGAVVPAAVVEMVAEAAPDGLALRFGADAEMGIFWETRDPQRPDAASGAFAGEPNKAALSPDGRRIAFIGYPSFGGAAVWRDGEVTPIAGTGIEGLLVGAVLWSDLAWREAQS
jgi:hypothetical protein